MIEQTVDWLCVEENPDTIVTGCIIASTLSLIVGVYLTVPTAGIGVTALIFATTLDAVALQIRNIQRHA